jgi:hypothetical protein
LRDKPIRARVLHREPAVVTQSLEGTKAAKAQSRDGANAQRTSGAGSATPGSHKDCGKRPE